MWKGKNKVKCSASFSDIENGGLKAPHLESIIRMWRVIRCKRFPSESESNWKMISYHHLKPVGNKFILCCNYDVKKLPISLLKYYKECLECLAECSAVAGQKD